MLSLLIFISIKYPIALSFGKYREVQKDCLIVQARARGAIANAAGEDYI